MATASSPRLRADTYEVSGEALLFFRLACVYAERKGARYTD